MEAHRPRDMRLQGKIALVTGSGQGIGQSIACRFAQEGADVIVHDRTAGRKADQTIAEVTRFGRRAHKIAADFTHPGAVQSLVAEAVSVWGRLDILVNNAGMEIHAPFTEVTDEDYDRVMAVNLRAPFFATQAFVRHLKQSRRPGKVVNVSSIHEDLPFPNFSTYCLSKGGLRMMTRTLAVELRGTGVTINGIAPGAIKTPINEDLMEDEEKVRALLNQIPLARMGTPGDVASVAVFLASSEADYVTGATYVVDGGLAIHYEEQ